MAERKTISRSKSRASRPKRSTRDNFGRFTADEAKVLIGAANAWPRPVTIANNNLRMIAEVFTTIGYLVCPITPSHGRTYKLTERGRALVAEGLLQDES